MHVDGRSFEALQATIRGGRVKVLPHFKQRADELGFTVDTALEVLTRGDA